LLFIQPLFYAVFLPLVLVGCFFIERYSQSHSASVAWLAVSSIVFYGYLNAYFLVLMCISILLNYYFATTINRIACDHFNRKIIFIVAIILNLAALGFFKYANFFLELFGYFFSQNKLHINIELPLGISFFTFTQIAYLTDVYLGYPNEKNFTKYFLFVTYFPHLIAGPILHHSEMICQFEAPHSRRISWRGVSVGVLIFSFGFFKKIIIADGFASIAAPVFLSANSSHLSMPDAWMGASAYALQIYFDFSGYCDMALGVSTMMNIRLPFNFDSPYKSQSIIEFWRRWHITLSRFLRDYVYIPIGGNRLGSVRRLFNLLITMLLGGLWHGAGITFLIWGGLHGFYLIINHVWVMIIKNIPFLYRSSATVSYRIISFIITQISVIFAWIFFKADNISTANNMVNSMVGFGKNNQSYTTNLDLFFIFFGYSLCLFFPNINSVFRKFNIGLVEYKNDQRWSAFNFEADLNYIWSILAALLIFNSILLGYLLRNSSPFLYFQF